MNSCVETIPADDAPAQDCPLNQGFSNTGFSPFSEHSQLQKNEIFYLSDRFRGWTYYTY
jgi:hypothetical protein